MSGKCITVIAGSLDDYVFNHICFVAESLTGLLPNFYHKTIAKNSTEWKTWLKETCICYGWSHTKSPLIWREIGMMHVNVIYIGGSYQFWELLQKSYNISCHLSKDNLEALQKDLIYAHQVKEKKINCLDIQRKRRKITIVGAGTSMCPELIAQLIMLKELWLCDGIAIYLYDEPGYFFKLRKSMKDSEAIGGGLNTVNVLDNVSEGLSNCDILIHLDALSREESEGLDSWLERNYKSIEELSVQINQHAPSNMKVIFCSTGPTCFYVNILHDLATKLPEGNIVAVSSHYGLELIYEFVNSLGFSQQNVGCPPVWGYLGINQFVDIYHMIQMCDIYQPINRKLAFPFKIHSSELRWFFYMAHDKDPYRNHFERKALLQYQVGRTEDFQKCKAIGDLLQLWFREIPQAGDEIITLGIFSNGSFGIPKGLAFSQPVHLKVLEDQSRVWVPFIDFPMPNMPLSIFQNLIETGVIIKNRITQLRNRKNTSIQSTDAVVTENEKHKFSIEFY